MLVACVSQALGEPAALPARLVGRPQRAARTRRLAAAHRARVRLVPVDARSNALVCIHRCGALGCTAAVRCVQDARVPAGRAREPAAGAQVARRARREHRAHLPVPRRRRPPLQDPQRLRRPQPPHLLRSACLLPSHPSASAS